MSRKSFEQFGKWAVELDDPFLISGRNGTDRDALLEIGEDICDKLDFCHGDSILEIGCGCYEVLKQIDDDLFCSSLKFTAIDHENFRKWIPPYVKFISGNFLDMDVSGLGKFNKILIYSVIHYLSDRSEVMVFLEKAFDLLLPGGLMLIGDIPNKDMKWRHEMFGGKYTDDVSSKLALDDEMLVEFDDSYILEVVKWFRSEDCNAWVLPQPPGLSLWCTREDILVGRLI